MGMPIVQSAIAIRHSSKHAFGASFLSTRALREPLLPAADRTYDHLRVNLTVYNSRRTPAGSERLIKSCQVSLRRNWPGAFLANQTPCTLWRDRSGCIWRKKDNRGERRLTVCEGFWREVLGQKFPLCIRETNTRARWKGRKRQIEALAGRGSDGGGGGGGVRGKGMGSGSSPNDGYGLYPWEEGNDKIKQEGDIEWVQDDIITLFTSEGVVRIGGQTVPRRAQAWQRRQMGLRGVKPPSRKWREEDYMNPSQGLCLGSIFDISATNGLDMGRRLCVFGFCRSVEMLSDVVQDVVLEQGGEVVILELVNDEGGLNERLSMTVAVPFLWGIPPAKDALRYAIRSGGGIVERVYQRWELL